MQRDQVRVVLTLAANTDCRFRHLLVPFSARCCNRHGQQRKGEEAEADFLRAALVCFSSLSVLRAERSAQARLSSRRLKPIVRAPMQSACKPLPRE